MLEMTKRGEKRNFRSRNIQNRGKQYAYILSDPVFVCLCDLLHAQTVRIAYEGDPLTDKSQKIELTLQYEVEFTHNSDFPIRLTLN